MFTDVHSQSRHWLLLNAALLLAVMWSAIAVVETSHECRQHYALLQEMQSSEWSLQEHWSRLLLEESTWAAHHRVEKLAVEKLSMRAPLAGEMKVVLR